MGSSDREGRGKEDGQMLVEGYTLLAMSRKSPGDLMQSIAMIVANTVIILKVRKRRF